jgi:hypothetical protein
MDLHFNPKPFLIREKYRGMTATKLTIRGAGINMADSRGTIRRKDDIISVYPTTAPPLKSWMHSTVVGRGKKQKALIDGSDFVSIHAHTISCKKKHRSHNFTSIWLNTTYCWHLKSNVHDKTTAI